MPISTRVLTSPKLTQSHKQESMKPTNQVPSYVKIMVQVLEPTMARSHKKFPIFLVPELSLLCPKWYINGVHPESYPLTGREGSYICFL
jgi:hypothetical protein